MRAHVTVQVPPPYTVSIGYDFCKENTLIECFKVKKERLVIITDSCVRSLYIDRVLSALAPFEPLVFDFPAGEMSKSRETKAHLEDMLFQAGVNRDTLILALGGGVVTDLVGFLASTYCRGVPTVYLPTTLLAMVDASVGGKTGVNTPFGKNLVGTFYQPKAVVMDTVFLDSLPPTELLNGFAEMIKHTILADETAFSRLLSHVQQVGCPEGLLSDRDWLVQALAHSVAIKKHFVEMDVCDKGARQVLNFGHTIGHAIENLSHYEVPHGYAVAIGMLIESYIALQEGVLAKSAFNKIVDGLKVCNFPLWTPFLENEDAVVASLHLDKKATATDIRFVMLHDIGRVHDGFVCQVAEEKINKALRWYNSRQWEE